MGDGELTARARAGPAMARLLPAPPRTSGEGRDQGKSRGGAMVGAEGGTRAHGVGRALGHGGRCPGASVLR
jgi:hypothetical protein